LGGESFFRAFAEHGYCSFLTQLRGVRRTLDRTSYFSSEPS
jgi:hypothetical protein